MGYEKDRMMQEDEQGWSFHGGNICFRCVTDSYLRRMVKDQASEMDCDFCLRQSRKAPISIPFDDFMEVYAGALFQYYSHAENEPIAWDSEDQQYVGTTYDTWDLVKDVIGEPSDNEEVVEAIIDSLGDHIWCDKSPYSLTGTELYETSWESFCQTVKHQIRYFFGAAQPDPYSDSIPVPEMLDQLRDIIDEAGLISELPAGTEFFRIRPHRRTEVCADWRSLGSPPPDAAASNRMSAAGISVFYAALDMATARAETCANRDPDAERVLTGAKWTNTRPLKILDLSRLPEPPSFFAQVRYDRDHLLFLRRFVESITQPVEHDGREHIEYVPSQIVTEYFRHRYRMQENSAMDGIQYPSAQCRRSRSVVIFASQDDLNPRSFEWSAEERTPLLTLDEASIRRIRRAARVAV
jgi:hypothetical protein